MGELMTVTVDMNRTATGAVHYTLPNWAAIKSVSGNMRLYGSVNGQSRAIHRLYGSVNGQAKEIKKLYGSVNGVSKRIY